MLERRLLQGLVKQGLLKDAKTMKAGFHEHYILGKHIRVKFGTAVHHTQGTLHYVYTGVWEPIKVASLGGKHCFVTFFDDFSRRVWVYTMQHKDEIPDVFHK